MQNNISYEGLSESEIEAWHESSASKIYPRLRGGLFHRTSIQGYFGIRSTGEIQPNRGQFLPTYPQSPHYLASYRGHVALFDFGSVTDQICISSYLDWGQYFFDQKPFTIVLQMNRSALADKLIANSDGPELGEPGYRSSVPYFEAWYPEPVPFDVVDAMMLVGLSLNGKGPTIDECPRDKVDAFDRLLRAIERVFSD